RPDTASAIKTLQLLQRVVEGALQQQNQESAAKSIRLMNSAFWESVGSVPGGIGLMMALGFELEDRGDGRGPAFVLRGDADRSLLELAQALLQEELAALGKGSVSSSSSSSSSGNASSSSIGAIAGASAQSDFNPYASAFSRKAKTRVQDKVEQKLEQLLEQRRAHLLRFDKMEDRNITVLQPLTGKPATGAAATSADANASLSSSEADAASSGDHSSEYDDDNEDDEELSAATASAVLQAIRSSRARQQTQPFASAAARRLHALRAARLRAYALVNVRFPDGVQLQARYNAQEDTVGHVVDVVRHSLRREVRHLPFRLSALGPTRALLPDQLLQEAGMVAAANVVHLKWEAGEEAKSSAAMAETMSVLRAELVQGARCLAAARREQYDVPPPITLS
ncbi:hypothetical protein JKP88DRAFT_333927, partial [Tribonema minus]